VSPYIRGLVAALHALAPDDAFVPLSEAVGHLHAIDPTVSGDLFGPAEVSARSGMPTYPWLERARAEQVLSLRDTDVATEAEIERVAALDPALGLRWRARRDARAHLRHHAILPTLRLQGAIRRIEPMDVAIIYDRMAPDGRWVRVRAELRVGAGGALSVVDGRLAMDESVQHLLSRQFSLPLDTLVLTLAKAAQGEVLRLSRAWIGPFWFPGVERVVDAPAELFSGLVLHASTEVVGVDLRGHQQADPLAGPPVERLPPGFGSFRERRFAASPKLVEPLRAWCASFSAACVVVPVVGGRPRRL
jgi:hypothetical protein